MSVIYKFSSLASLADYLDNYGRQVEDRATRAKQRDAELLKREAYAYGSIAELIRHTIIEPTGEIQ